MDTELSQLGETKRLMHLAPLEALVRDLTISSFFIAVSLLVLGYFVKSLRPLKE